MLDALKKNSAPETMLKHFLFFALFYPAYYSVYNSPFSPDGILVNVFAFLLVVVLLVQKRIPWREKNPFAWGLLGLLVLYNLAALRANLRQLDWYSSQFNLSVPFLMFIALLYLKGDSLEKSDEVIRYFLRVVVIANALWLVPYFLGYYGLDFANGRVSLIPVDPSYYERRYNGIYLHKSQYAFMLILFLSLIVTYRRLFRSKWTYYGAVGVMVVGLVISNVMTSMFAALFIFIGMLADRIFWKNGRFQPKRLLWLIPVAAVLVLGLVVISQKRNIFTLGSRTYIWKAGLTAIQENPYGVGRMAGLLEIPLSDAWAVNNTHNVFMNLMYQFSIPAGLALSAMLGLIGLTSLKRNLSFRTLGILVALLLPMMMDWCILMTDLPMVLLEMYYLFFSARRLETETAESKKDFLAKS